MESAVAVALAATWLMPIAKIRATVGQVRAARNGARWTVAI
jgi:hypothetical protein